MNLLLKASKAILYFISFVVFTLVALRLTIDLNELKPTIEKFLSLKTGAKCEIQNLELQGVLGLSLASVELTLPLSPEQELEWDKFRAYLKARRAAKEAGQAEPEPMKAPAPAPKLCLQSSQIDLGLGNVLSIVLGGHIELSGQSKLFACGVADDDSNQEEPQYLSFSVGTQWDGLGASKRAQDLAFSYKLNEIDLGENDFLQSSLPMPLKGKLTSQGEGHIVIGKLGRLQIKKSSASLKLEGTGLQTEATTVSALELPAVNLGDLSAQLKLDRGQLDLVEFKSQSEDIKGEFTGHLKLFGAWARTVLNLHISMDLSAEFIRKNPDVKTIATLQRRYFTRRGDGGYDVGILLKGRVKKPRASAAKNSPYSKEGRSLNRNARNNKQAKRPTKRRRNRPAKKARQKNRLKNKSRRDRIKAGRRNRVRKGTQVKKNVGFKANKGFRSNPGSALEETQDLVQDSESELNDLEAGEEIDSEAASNESEEGAAGEEGEETEADSDSEATVDGELDNE